MGVLSLSISTLNDLLKSLLKSMLAPYVFIKGPTKVVIPSMLRDI